MTIEIPPINIDTNSLDIPDIPTWLTSSPPIAIPPVAPVTEVLGVPIINIPGCVEAHEEGSKTIMEDDPDGVRVYCDANTPSFDPIQYEPENMVIERTAPVPKVPAPETPETPQVPDTSKVVPINTATTEEPAERPTPFIEKYLPSAPEVTTTATIALVATTSALLAKPLADILLKVIKPTIKKVVAKVKEKLGKKTTIESLKERRDQQRIRSHAIRKLKGKE